MIVLRTLLTSGASAKALRTVGRRRRNKWSTNQGARLRLADSPIAPSVSLHKPRLKRYAFSTAPWSPSTYSSASSRSEISRPRSLSYPDSDWTKRGRAWSPSGDRLGTGRTGPLTTGAAKLVPDCLGFGLQPDFTNIEGDARLSDRDGAGSIRVNRADDIVRAGQWIPMTHTCGDPGDRVVLTMNLSAWARTRVLIARGEDSDDPAWPGQPNADIEDAAGAIVASLSSYPLALATGACLGPFVAGRGQFAAS